MSDNSTAGTTPTPVASEPAPAAPVAVPAPVITEAPAPVDTAGQSGPGKADAPAIGRDGAGAQAPVGETPAVAAEPAPAAPIPAEPAAPAYTDFKFPEGVKAAPEALEAVTKIFGEHNLPQEAAQKLLDAHFADTQKAVAQSFETATAYWNQKSKDWVAEVQADPQIGGNRFKTSIETARGVWTDVLPNEADRTRLFADLTDTKMGDHPVLARAMTEMGRRLQQVYQLTGTTKWADAMKKLREPGAPPPGNPARAPGAAGRPADRRYTTRT
jgi:hypothetical protein